MDALLGAAALGDIGDHFPDSDDKWKDARSVELLTIVRDKLAQRGYAIRSIDAAVACEAPRLGPYRDRMRLELAAATRLDRNQVSVKFGTNEGMGFVGRGEGIACMATATIEWVG
jgi:2-C-methyl-D-erythritol 2,4-cyclodiphosphate synthase